jgi:2,5-furandicarboxylate decarboxylase 1
VLVPAWAELVLEGQVLAGEREMEGPMPEFTGHYSGADPKHVARMTAITHPADPIFQTMNGGGYEHVSLGNMITSGGDRGGDTSPSLPRRGNLPSLRTLS